MAKKRHAWTPQRDAAPFNSNVRCKSMKNVALIIFLFLSTNALACTIPRGGEAYNSLIKVEMVDDGNHFRLTVPQSAGSLKYGADIVLAYYQPRPEYKGYRPAEIYVPLEIKEEGANYASTFVVEKKNGYKAYIQVFWLPKSAGLCGAFGESSDLNVK